MAGLMHSTSVKHEKLLRNIDENLQDMAVNGQPGRPTGQTDHLRDSGSMHDSQCKLSNERCSTDVSEETQRRNAGELGSAQLGLAALVGNDLHRL